MMNFIHARMSVGARLGLIAGLLIIPTLMFAGLFIVQANKEIRFAERERLGVQYVRALVDMFESGAPASASALAAQTEFDAVFATSEASQRFFRRISSGTANRGARFVRGGCRRLQPDARS